MCRSRANASAFSFFCTAQADTPHPLPTRPPNPATPLKDPPSRVPMAVRVLLSPLSLPLPPPPLGLLQPLRHVDRGGERVEEERRRALCQAQPVHVCARVDQQRLSGGGGGGGVCVRRLSLSPSSSPPSLPPPLFLAPLRRGSTPPRMSRARRRRQQRAGATASLQSEYANIRAGSEYRGCS